jgi:UDP-N-acetylmuramate-alanine ligase
LYLDLDYAIITSLELDHTDYYKDMEDYLSAFQQLADKVKKKIFIPKELKFVPTRENIQEVAIKKFRR